MTDQDLTTQDAADFFRVHVETIREWIRNGKLTAYRPGGGQGPYRITRRSIEALRNNSTYQHSDIQYNTTAY